MRKETKRKLTEAGKVLLEIGSDLGELSYRIVFEPYRLSIHNMHVPTYYRNIHSLEKNGLIKKRKVSGRSNYRITEAGKKMLRARPIQKKRRVDGYSTLIIFDIPEEKSKARTSFRRYLIKNGYAQFQKSTFISPYELTEDILDLARELRIISCINIFY